MVEREYVVKMFNEMNEDYDDLKDLWYSWLFSRLHYFIANDVILPIRPKKVLDIGCGTGFQSFLYAITGSEVVGIDIADKLIEIANNKIGTFNGTVDFKLFPSYYSFVNEYEKRISNSLKDYIDYKTPRFELGDAMCLRFPDESFDHVNICGSVINFVEDYQKMIYESVRVLKKNGTLFIEYDTKWNVDIFWSLLDSCLGGILEYGIPLRDSTRNLLPPFNKHIELEYPFGDIDKTVIMTMKLFTNTEIINAFRENGCRVLSHRTIHSITNLLPSTLLDTATPSQSLISCFDFLRKIEEKNWNLPGCSSVILFQKF